MLMSNVLAVYDFPPPIKPFPSQVALVVVFHHSDGNTDQDRKDGRIFRVRRVGGLVLNSVFWTLQDHEHTAAVIACGELRKLKENI